MGEIITEKELCEWLKITQMTAYRWRKAGMPYMGKTKSIRYDKEKVQQWLEQRGSNN